ncbi:hypothetical protein SCUP515_05009, partial [Seiridium cupressi]
MRNCRRRRRTTRSSSPTYRGSVPSWKHSCRCSRNCLRISMAPTKPWTALWTLSRKRLSPSRSKCRVL